MFQPIQKLYQTVGINLPLSNRRYPLNARNLFYLLSFLPMFISSTSLFLFKANNIIDYTISFYVFLTELVSLIQFTIELYKVPMTIELIEKFEKQMEKSKWLIDCDRKNNGLECRQT